MSNVFLDTLQGKRAEGTPFWFMRQAGRYLPEYREIRSGFKDFLEFCYTPEAAAKVTLQPIARFDMSAAIIFSDILVIPHALGMKVWFEEKIGPQLTPVGHAKNLSFDVLEERLVPVYEAIRLTRGELPKDKSLIGFAGAPWTLACYMIEGKGSRDFQKVKIFVHEHKEAFESIIKVLIDAVSKHAIKQIEAGCDTIQLFDSWSGVTSEREFADYVIEPTTQIVANIKKKHPQVPVIGFPRMAGGKIISYAKETNVDAVSFDHSVTLEGAEKNLQPELIVQGNLDNVLLATDRSGMLLEAKNILDRLAGTNFIFNLGHGVLPHTPVDHVMALSDLIRAYR
jgi:uroporphyrinogen decarboxylase